MGCSAEADKISWSFFNAKGHVLNVFEIFEE